MFHTSGPGGRTIKGSVIITGPDYTCIDCGSVTHIMGCFSIHMATRLQDVRCDMLQSTSNTLAIRNNMKLTSLKTNSLRMIGGSGLYVVATAIRSIQFPVASIDTIHIKSNQNMQSVAFPLLATTDRHFHADTNPALTTLSVPVLSYIGSDLHLHGNTATLSYDFPVLKACGEDIEMSHSPWLTSALFPMLARVEEDVELYRFPSLERIEFPSLKSAGEDLELWDLALVKSIVLPKLEAVQEDFEVFNNLMMEMLDVPSLNVIEEDLDFYCNRQVQVLNLPDLMHIWEDLQIFGNDNLRKILWPSLSTVAVVEGGGWLVTTNRKLSQLSFPKLVALGRIRDPDGGNEEITVADGSKAVLLYSGVSAAYNKDRPFVVADNPQLQRIHMTKLVSMSSGGFWVQANPVLRLINLRSTEQLGQSSYFVVRDHPKMGAGSLRMDLIKRSHHDPIFSSAKCNTPNFTLVPSWARPDWFPLFCPNGAPKCTYWCNSDAKFSMWPTSQCDSPLECTDKYYLWARENDYDFEENIVQLQAPPQFSAVRRRRDRRIVRGSPRSISGSGVQAEDRAVN